MIEIHLLQVVTAGYNDQCGREVSVAETEFNEQSEHRVLDTYHPGISSIASLYIRTNNSTRNCWRLRLQETVAW
jgi:hypothetical protein